MWFCLFAERARLQSDDRGIHPGENLAGRTNAEDEGTVEHDAPESGASHNPRALSQVGAGDVLVPVQTRSSSGIELSRELCRMVNMRMKPRSGFCVHAPVVEGIGQFEFRIVYLRHPALLSRT